MAPRFSEENITVLKKTMLQRAPECVFTDEDLAVMQQATGLSEVQMKVWAENFYYRVPPAERADVLAMDKTNEQVGGWVGVNY